MRIGVAKMGLWAAIAVAVPACARDNPEFGLGADGGGTAGSSTAEDTGRVPPGQQATSTDATVGLDDGPTTSGIGTTDPTAAVDTSSSDDGLDTADVSDSGGNLCDVPSCELYIDRCADGFKCTLVDDSGDGTFEKLGCSPLPDSPAGELDACSYDVCWQDSCGAGLACAATGPGEGICRAMCQEAQDPCTGPEEVCVEVLGQVGLCRPGCQILLQDCANGEGCFFEIDAAESSCALENRANEAGAECSSYDDCAVGNLCMPSAFVGGCPGGAASCCTQVCDATAGNPCSGGTVCIGLSVPGQEEAGVCV